MAGKSTKGAAKAKKQLMDEIKWSIILAGVLSVLFGLVAVFWPGLTLALAIVMFGVFMILMGVVWLYEAFTHIKQYALWWLVALFGILMLIVGVYSLGNPELTIKIFAIILVVYVFAQSLLDLIIASYGKGSDRWLWVLTGTLGIIFGFVIMFNPVISTLAIIWVMGLFAIIHGVAAIIWASTARIMIK